MRISFILISLSKTRLRFWDYIYITVIRLIVYRLLHQIALLTNHGYGVRSDDVFGQLDIGRVAYHHDIATRAIYVESYVRGGDPAALRGWLGSRGVAFEIVTIHSPFDICRRIRVLRGAGDHHLFVRLCFRGPRDRHSGWRDWGKKQSSVI